MTTLASNVFNGSVTVTGQAPSFVTTPQIDGQTISGETLEVSSFTYSGTEPVTITYQRGAVVGGDIGGATSPSYLQTDADYGKTFYWRVTLTNALGSVSHTATAATVTGKVFTEDWAAFTIGNSETEVLAGGYARNNTQWECDVLASTLSPSGKSLSWFTTTNSSRQASRTDIITFGTANSSDVYEELFLLEHTGGATPTFYLRGSYNSNPALQGPGINIRADILRHQVDADSTSAAEPVTTIQTLTANQQFFLRHQVYGTTSRIKVWDYGDAEPSLWTSTRAHANGTGSIGPALGARTTGGAEVAHFYSVGFNATAPFPVNYFLPPEGSSDPLTYAAAAPATTITMADGDIVWSFEDA